MSGTGLAPVFFETGTPLAASGSTPSFSMTKPFNFILAGDWVGTVALEASGDGGATWVNCIMPDGSQSAFTINGFYAAPNVWQKGVIFRLTFTRSDGALNWSVGR